MTPFLQFRVWVRRGPNGERIATGFAFVMVLALIVWTAVPLRDDGSAVELGVSAETPTDQQVAATTAPSPTEAPPDSTAPESAPAGGIPDKAGGGSAGGSQPGGPAAKAGGPAANGSTGAGEVPTAKPCSGLRATDQGVSAEEIFVAVPFVNLGGEVGNQTFGYRSNLKEVAEAAAAGINGEGGVACRKLRIKTYAVNPLDASEQRATCLRIAADKPFAVIDFLGYVNPVARSCFVDEKLPYQSYLPVNEGEAAGAYPFMYSLVASTDRALRNWVFESAARGWFDPQNGFRKLGLLLDECNPKANAELIQNLAKVGVPGNQTSTFTLSGCSNINSQSQISQAIAQHREADVSHVFLFTILANSQSYVRGADTIRWAPTYMTSGTITTNPAAASQWPGGFDGALAITSRRSGERNSGITHPEVGHCNEWMKNANVRASENESDENPMGMCDMFRLFTAAANAAGPNLQRTTLLEDGLAKAGRFEGAAHSGGVFDRPRKVTGGDFIRAIQWRRDCTCWKVLDPDLKPGREQ